MSGTFSLIILALLLVLFTAIGVALLLAARRLRRAHHALDAGAITTELANHPDLLQLRDKLDELHSEIEALREQQRFLERMLERPE